MRLRIKLSGEVMGSPKEALEQEGGDEPKGGGGGEVMVVEGEKGGGEGKKREDGGGKEAEEGKKQQQQQQQQEGEEEIAEEEEGSRSHGSSPRAAEADAVTCSQCGKSFPSLKSLYGHMRCHPEREWRGVIPPQGTSKPKPPSTPPNLGASDHHPDGGTLTLLTWSTTHKRGRKGTVPHSPVRSYCPRGGDYAEVSAVCNLMLMANGGRCTDPVEREVAVDPSCTEEGGDVSDHGSPSNPAEEYLQSEKMASCRDDLEQTGETVPEAMEDVDEELHDEAPETKRKRKVRDVESLHEPVPAASSSRRYTCGTCNKSFPTHQALGGHRASHKKESSGAVAPGSAAEAGAPPSSEVAASKPAEASEHQCNICGMVFSSGQALGGHKRKHWNGHDGSSSSATAPPRALPGTGGSPPEPPKGTGKLSSPGHENPAAAVPSETSVMPGLPRVAAPAAPMFDESALRRGGGSPVAPLQGSAQHVSSSISVKQLEAAPMEENTQYNSPWMSEVFAATPSMVNPQSPQQVPARASAPSPEENSQQHGLGATQEPPVSPGIEKSVKMASPPVLHIDLNEKPQEEEMC